MAREIAMSTPCPRCAFANPNGVQACTACGAPLSRTCPACGFENPAPFNFCGSCGAALSTAPKPHVAGDESRSHIQSAIPAELAEKMTRLGKQLEGERRTVTVLFADLCGFTTISEKLDPEEVYALIDKSLKAFTAEIYKHEGTLDKFMGDGVMALFGAPVAHEDDPARALRAALGMHNELREINREWESRLGASLQVRIGLNFGTVVVGGVGSDLRMNYTALGDTVNVASRLQTLAEPGATLVSRPLFEQTRPLFEFRELGSIRVKGRVEPVEIFEVIAPRQTPGRLRGVPGLAAPMVGREAEFSELRRVVDELIADRRGRIVLVTGDAGIGKSRLKSELKQYLARKPVTAYEGACLAYGQPAYGVFLNLLRSFFKIGEEDPEESVREKVERGVRRALSPDQPLNSVLPYIEKLLSIRIVEKEMEERVRYLEPARLQQQTFLAVRDLLAAQAQQEPLLLIFEDIHWIDKLSLDLLNYLLQSVERFPLVLYANSRRAEGAAEPQIRQQGEQLYPSRFVHIPLQPLSQADSVALIDLLLAIAELPETLKRIIPQRAEGNPFYLEELLRMLIDRGTIRRVDERWEIAPNVDLSELEMPQTLEGLIMARVDHLGETVRETVQYAAVIGRDFSYRLLAQVVPDSRPLDAAIQELEEHSLVKRIPGADEREYRFHHVLVRETVYHSLLRRRRDPIHHKIAQGIEQLYKERLEEHVEQIAYHYSESKDAARALPYLVRAGQRAADRFANDQAVRSFRHAADWIAEANASLEQRLEIYQGLGNVQTFVGDYDGALDSYHRALDLLSALGARQPRASAETMRRIGRVFERRGDNAQALHWLERALKELDRGPDTGRAVERVRIYNDVGWVHYRLGNFEEAYQWRMKSLQIVEGSEHYNELASAYNGLVALFIQQGDWARCDAYAEKGLRLRETLGDSYGVCQSHTNLGVTASLQGLWDQALGHLERSLEIAEEIGYVAGVSNLNNNLAIMHREKGNYDRARLLFRQALEIAEKIKNGNLTCQALNNLAHLEILEGLFEPAGAALTRSLVVATEMDSKEHLAEAQWLVAESRLGQGQTVAADEAARQALKIASDIGSRSIEGETLRTLAKIDRARKDLASADEHLARSLAIFIELKNPFETAKSQYVLALLHRDQGEILAARAELEKAHSTFARLGAQAEQRRALAQLDDLASSPPAPQSPAMPR